MGGLTIEEQIHRKELFEQGLKHCRKCDRTLPLEAFDRNNSRKDGRVHICKECKRKNSKRPHAGNRKRRIAERERLRKAGLKRCGKCKKILPIEKFFNNNRNLDKLAWNCKICQWKRMSQAPTWQREKTKKAQRELRKQGLKRCSKCGQARPISEFHKLSRSWDGLASNCKWCSGYTGEKARKAQEKQRLYQKGLKCCSICREAKLFSDFYKNASHSDGLSARCKKCNERRRGTIDIHRRRARLQNLPADFSMDDWQIALNYFGNACAYCGNQKSTAQDHFVPIARNGGTVKTNIIPACTKCNCSKNASEPFEWMEENPRVSRGAVKDILSYLRLA